MLRNTQPWDWRPTPRAPASGTGNITNNFSVGLAVTAWGTGLFGRVASLKEQALARYLATEEGRNAAQVSLISSVANGWLELAGRRGIAGTVSTHSGYPRRVGSPDQTAAGFWCCVRARLPAGRIFGASCGTTLAQQQRQRALDENALALLLGQPCSKTSAPPWDAVT